MNMYIDMVEKKQRRSVKGKKISDFADQVAKFDFIKNYPLTPGDLRAGSFDKVWWKDSCGHSYQSQVVSHVAQDQGCPEKECIKNRIYDKREIVNKLSDYPEQVAQFDFEQNAPLTPDRISAGSQKKVWWIGRPCGHSYYSKVADHVVRDQGCSERDCLQKRIKETNLAVYGVACPLQSDVVRQKTIKTCLDKFGFEHPNQSPEQKAKTKVTVQRKYGVDNIFQVKEFQEKAKETMMEQYGVAHPMHSAEIKEKVKETNLLRRGVEYPMQSPAVKEKAKENSLINWGVEHPRQTEIVQQKAIQTCLERYGVPYSLMVPEVIQKGQETMMLRYGVRHAVLNEEINARRIATNLERYNVEFVLPDEEARKRAVATLQLRYNVSNPAHMATHWEKYKQTSLQNWGTEYPFQSTECRELNAHARYKMYDLTVDDKTFIGLQGYEKFFVTSKEYNVNEIEHGKTVPRVPYELAGGSHMYFPDFFIPSENLIIEVKSTYTFVVDMERCITKANACIDKGYNFEFRIYDPKGNLVSYLDLLDDQKAEVIQEPVEIVLEKGGIHRLHYLDLGGYSYLGGRGNPRTGGVGLRLMVERSCLLHL